MARKAHGISDLTATEQQSGYSPERLAEQIKDCLRPIPVTDERGFEFLVYPRDPNKPKPEKSTIKIKPGKIKGMKVKEIDLDDLSGLEPYE